MGVTRFLKRNFVSILFPSVSATCIYLDWSHTKKWKELQKKY